MSSSVGRVWAWRSVVFFAEASYMLFELLAVRVLSPTFGSMLDVWTAIIGCVLLAGAVGNWIGGRLSHIALLPVWSLCATSLLCALVPYLAIGLPQAVNGSLAEASNAAGALLTSFALFFLPCVGAGVIPPVAMTSAMGSADDNGRAAGGIYAAATLGGLAGTFFGGFFLIPAFGVRLLVGCVAVIYAVLAFACWLLCCERSDVKGAALSVACVVASVTMALSFGMSTMRNESLLVDADTRYGHVTVVEDSDMRRMLVDGGFESAMYIGDGRESELVFPYLQCIGSIADPMLQDSSSKALCLGGAAYNLPKHLLDATKASVDVCEIDEGVTEAARTWFALDEVVGRHPGRFSVEHIDGRVFADGAGDDAYDVVVNDTFAGNTPARSLTTVEAIESIRASLRPGGVYMVNIIGNIDDSDGFFLHELATLASVFDDVRIISPYESMPQGFSKLNWVVVCGDDLSDMDVSDAFCEYGFPDTSNASVLTDDWCPVEAMVSTD